MWGRAVNINGVPAPAFVLLQTAPAAARMHAHTDTFDDSRSLGLSDSTRASPPPLGPVSCGRKFCKFLDCNKFTLGPRGYPAQCR